MNDRVSPYTRHNYRKIRSLKGGEPLRTFAELAEEFGVKPSMLLQAMRDFRDTPHPKPMSSFRETAGGSPHRTYYRPSEMRAWWGKYQEWKRQKSQTPPS